ncbi:MAG TPA: YqzL family protein [Firmicutes bacterium]|nr:YqzL family protein [Bacillota bacterium]
MNSLEWEMFKRTGKVDHYLLLKETELISNTSNDFEEFSEELVETERVEQSREE